MTNITSRRALLSGAATIPLAMALRTPANARTGKDPVFAAIERHRRLATAWDAWAGRESDPDPELDADWSEADAARLEGVMRTSPTTAAGCIAMLRYVEDYAGRTGGALFAQFAGGPLGGVGDAGAHFLSNVAAAIEAIEERSAA